jgi:hypothetical protein
MPMPRHIVIVAASDKSQLVVIERQYLAMHRILAKRLNGSEHLFELTSAGPLASHGNG